MPTDFWMQRDIFREWVAEAKAKLGAASNAAVAECLGIVPASLYKYLSNSSTHKPGPDVLKKLGDLIGRDYRLLLSVPEQPPEWLEAGEWSDATERDKLIARAMYQDLTADQLTEAEKDEIYRAYKEAKERVMRLRSAYKKELE
jgi:hypothetical protein